ncbi:MAG: type II toxin-antitoxin system Phd/YefM family antitoxin [Candidatus Binatia bacterium]
MSKTMPISEVKTRLPELVSGVEEREDEIVVTRNGKPAAVLVNYDEYERLKETLDVLSDPVSMKQIAQSKRFYTKGRRGESFEDLFGESLVAHTNVGSNSGRLSARYPTPRRGDHSALTSRIKAWH